MLISLAGPGPRFQQIYRAIYDLIVSGKLTPGMRLPVTRQLARDLGVSRNAVLIAYEQLIANGLASARVGSGTYVKGTVRTMLRPASPGIQPAALRVSRYARKLLNTPASLSKPLVPVPYDFDCAAASPEDFPAKRWQKLAAHRLQTPSVNYLHPAGDAGLREALAAHLRISRGVDAGPDQILIVNGSSQALDLVARVLIDERDTVIIEDPNYRVARDIFLSSGARLLPIRADPLGLRTSELPPDSCAVKLAYVTPSHQFPSGGVLSRERRQALLTWAGRTGAYIVEDDYSSEYFYGHPPIEALQGIDRRGLVIYVGTFSRILSPSMRLGYLVLPKALVVPFLHAKHLVDCHSAALPQQILADFIRAGYLAPHVRECRTRKANLRAALLDSIARYLGPRAKVRGADSGVHLVLSLPDLPPNRIPPLCAAAGARGLRIYPASPFYLTPPNQSEFIMGYAAMTVEKIVAGIRVLGVLLRQHDFSLTG
ncbi:MAG TPA: PLP-dependent aminotransferase family protein [Bryobacteraceae bacterium]|nr:PLP-dependent aminotransferase family protein [Bryobacteraceae bacterium]